MEELKLIMNKWYDVCQQALDLQKLYLTQIPFPEDLVGHDIDIILNRRNCLAATLQIIRRNFPELYSLNLCNNKLSWLDVLADIIEKAPNVKILNSPKLRPLKLEELWLEGNPLCSISPERSANT
ncbi:nuclear RNA export factor 5-like, partial [Otolemur garnettii]|uniref:nuclear RNA export factor 5-like n=1 Tax=Otolemur garnettii TaxID=30611 RepID=UPI0006445EB5